MSLGFRLTPLLTGVGLGILDESTQFCKLALIPLTPSPFLGKRELDSKFSSLSGRGIKGKGCKIGMHPFQPSLLIDCFTLSTPQNQKLHELIH